MKKVENTKEEKEKHRIKIRQNTPRHSPSNVFPCDDTLRSVNIFLDSSSMPVILREGHCVVNFRSRQFSAAEKQSRGMKYASQRRRHFFMRTYHRSARISSVCTYDDVVCCATATAL